MPEHQPLHMLSATRGPVRTGGRLEKAKHEVGWIIRNAHTQIPIELGTTDIEPSAGLLLRVDGDWDGRTLSATSCEVVHRPATDSSLPKDVDAGRAIEARASAYRQIREYFDDDGFVEVETPAAVPSPGTDIYLQPVGTRRLADSPRRRIQPFLHTSPEFAMKRLLTEGFERIYQICKVWRDGEVTDRHHPEFTMLEWYRAWEDDEAIMRDVEAIVAATTDGEATVVDRDRTRQITVDPPFERITMQELVDRACGFDLLEALDYPTLRRRVAELELLGSGLDRRHPPDSGRWDELFFELMVTHIEPELADMGAVFVTEWPAPLAVLARKSGADPRVARRFELYVGGVELANGFDELCDPDEQRRRFQEDIDERKALGKPTLPMPEMLLDGLSYGLPPSAGVALGLDRLLMLRTGARSIEDVLLFARDGGLRDRS